MRIVVPLTVLFLFVLASRAQAERRNVPSEYATIQSAIDACTNGDTVLVAPGVYFENITFRGKNIVVASQFALTGDVQAIYQTVIDGSQPVNQDSASVVRIIGGEDSTAVLMGFTIRGGTGTAWPDEHSPGTYQEGAGIHIALSGPTIRNNFIIRNTAIRRAGLASAGGGGIRAGDGFPKILNNVIVRNRGPYGAGIVLNYTGAIVRNNILCQNTGGEDYGGGGIWINGTGPYPKLIENNTIVGNTAVGGGAGIMMFSSTNVTARNNIIVGNAPDQIAGALTMNVSYSDVQGGWSGMGNFDAPMSFEDSTYYLDLLSACIDAGDPDIQFNDPADAINPTLAAWPSRGTLRNDVGAFGGPGRSLLPIAYEQGMYLATLVMNFGSVKVGETKTLSTPFYSIGNLALEIDSVVIKNRTSGIVVVSPSGPTVVPGFTVDSIRIAWTPTAVGIQRDTVLIYHRDTMSTNPRQIRLTANGLTDILGEEQMPSSYQLHQNHPNPFNPTTKITLDLPTSGLVTLRVYNMMGQWVSTLVQRRMERGRHQVEWDGRNADGLPVSSGVYLYRMEVNGKSWTRGMVFLK